MELAVPVRLLAASLWLAAGTFHQPLRADIPWPEVLDRVAEKNAALASRPQGRDGQRFVVCTLYYTPRESGFTAERGFDVTPETRPGLGGRRYGRDFLAAVKLEGFGRLREPVGGDAYLRYRGEGEYAYASRPLGRGTRRLVARHSCAVGGGVSAPRELVPDAELEFEGAEIAAVFKSWRWTVVDTGGALRPGQVDLYWGEDDPRGPGPLLARPLGTDFEHGFATVRRRR